MELDYHSPPISWTRFGYPLLHTRPYHTLHRSKYSTYPRIYPIEHHPSIIYPPTPNQSQTPKSSPSSIVREFYSEGEESPFEEDDHAGEHLDLARECARADARMFSRKQWTESGNDEIYVPEWLIEEELFACVPQRNESSSEAKHIKWGVTSREARRGNCLCLVDISGECVLIWSQSGRVGGLVVYRLNEDGRLFKGGETLMQTAKAVKLKIFDEEVLEVSQGGSEMNWEEEERIISVRTKGAVVCLKVHLNFRLSLYYTVELNDVVDVATCSVLPDEAVVLHERGSRISIVEKRDTMTGSVSCLLDNTQTFQALWHGAHKRSVLVASNGTISRVNLTDSAKALPAMLIDVKEEWRLPVEDYGISVCAKHPKNPFQTVIVTETRLAIADERMFRFPVLDWSLSKVHKFSNMRCSVSNLSSERGIAVALGSGCTGSLEIFHSVPLKRGVLGGIVSDNPFGAFKANQMFSGSHTWSDLPLGTIDTFPPNDPIAGVGVLTHNHHGERFHLIQASSSGILASQLFGCDQFLDNERSFEVSPAADASGQIGIDNHRDVRALCFSIGKETQFESVPYKTYCRNEKFGLEFAKNIRRPCASNILRIRQALTSDRDDDVHLPEFGRTPRPFLRERKAVKKQRKDILEIEDESTFLDGLVAFLCIPRTLSEILEYTRRDYSHAATPVSVKTVVGALNVPEIKEYSVGNRVSEPPGTPTGSRIYTTNDSLEEEAVPVGSVSDRDWNDELRVLERSFWEPLSRNERRRLWE